MLDFHPSAPTLWEGVNPVQVGNGYFEVIRQQGFASN